MNEGDAVGLDLAYDDAMRVLETASIGSQEFVDAVANLSGLVERGYFRACGVLAELFALNATMHDPEEAYINFFMATNFAGEPTHYANEHPTGARYLGPPGDFRNEALVSDMICEFGADKIPALDQIARARLEALSRR